MFKNFKYESIPLDLIFLDVKNPRIVTHKPLKTQSEIISYLYEHEDLDAFVKKIATETKNIGAERPYVVKYGAKYTVVEGNTRIAAYRLLCGLNSAPKGRTVPQVSKALRESLMQVDCSIAPSRDAMLPIMAKAHFGEGDKTKWGYLGSRQSLYNEWISGKSVSQLASAYGITKAKVGDYLIEYLLYLEALKYKWSDGEREILVDPRLEFNPPVRFLQTSGHRKLVGVEYDKVNMQVIFDDA